MTKPILNSRYARRLLIGAAGVILAGALVAASKPSLTLEADAKPIDRTAMEPVSFSAVVKKVSPSVVKITTETKMRTTRNQGFGLNDPFFRQFFGDRLPEMRQAPQAGLGSGVVVSADGYIVTNNHVIEKADKILVSFDNGRELKARVIGRDPHTDIAVIKVEAKDLNALSFASSAKVEVGDRVLAVGNPFGIGETVTTGIVSAKSRRPGLGIAYEDFIQTDAAINPGNSGGALVDIQGRLIGINTAILSRSGGFQGVGLAVPSDLVRNVVQSLVANGKVVRGFIGVTIQPLSNDMAESFGLKHNNGAVIADVTPDGPADKAGLRSGDIITKVGDVDIKDSSEVSLSVGQTTPGTKLDITVLRDSSEEKVSVTVGTMPRNFKAGANRGNRFGSEDDEDSDSLGSAETNNEGVLNGVSVTDIDANTRSQLRLPSRFQGALITTVDPESASARAGLKRGDVILEINGKQVVDADSAVKLSEEASGKKTRIKLWSRGSTIFTVVDESDEE